MLLTTTRLEGRPQRLAARAGPPRRSRHKVRVVTPATASTPIVGRDREVRMLHEAIAASASGHGQVVLLEGEPGIGKTRLVAAAIEQARNEGFEVASGTCDDLAQARPFGAILSALGITTDAPDP